MDSDSEALRRNPTDGSFAVLAFQLAAFGRGRQFLLMPPIEHANHINNNRGS